MKFTPTQIPDIIVIELDVYRDPRGFFLESFQTEKYKKAGIAGPFVQDNFSSSTKGTLRGLHAQQKFPQGKLVWPVNGTIFDVAVDIRQGSPTFKKWIGIELSSEKGQQIYVPPGFAHGFLVMSETAQVAYKCTDFYHPEDEMGLMWNDPEIGVTWPLSDPILSKKDQVNSAFQDLLPRLPRYTK